MRCTISQLYFGKEVYMFQTLLADSQHNWYGKYLLLRIQY